MPYAVLENGNAILTFMANYYQLHKFKNVKKNKITPDKLENYSILATTLRLNIYERQTYNYIEIHRSILINLRDTTLMLRKS